MAQFALVLCAMFSLVSWVEEVGTLSPPGEIPFSLAADGEKAALTVRISERRKYTLAIGYKFDPASKDDWRRVLSLAGAMPATADQASQGSSRPIAVALAVSQMSGDRHSGFGATIYGADLYRRRSDSFDGKLVDIDLFPGVYKIEVTNVLPVPRLIEVRTTFQLHETYIGK